MRKFLSLALVFALSITIFGIGFNPVQAEATEDVTITIHIHQYDGEYTNTGIGVWDGQNWNGWGALQSSVDEFGAVVVLNYSAAEINAVMDSIQFEITKDSVGGAGGDDAAAQGAYLSPGDGKTFLDVTELKAGTVTELEVYYVEGAMDFVAAEADFGQVFVVYADPTVAANLAVYDIWNMWTWNNGALGSADGVDFTVDMNKNTGTYDVPMKLGVINVGADADQDSGFIVRTEDWAKQCATDMTFDNTSVRGSGAMVYYYQADSCELETDGAAFLAAINSKYEMNAGNRFLEGTIINTPTEVAVELLMPKNPGAYDISRFILKDIEGNVMPVTAVNVSTASDLGTFTSDVTCGVRDNYFVLYVDTTLDHSLLGIVGSLNGWDIGNVIPSTKDDENGLAVFEVCTTDASGDFKLLFDAEGDGFAWNVDPEITPNNQGFAFNGEKDVKLLIKVSDIQVGSYSPVLPTLEAAYHLIVHVDSALTHADLGMVGTVQGWDIGNLIMSTQDDTLGYAVFEVVLTEPTGEFKILHDPESDGFAWSVDPEVTPDNQTFDFGTETTLEIFIDELAPDIQIVDGDTVVVGTATLELAAQEAQRTIIVYVKGAIDNTKLGIVGTVQGWDISNPIMSVGDDSYGFAIFEVVVDGNSGEFTIVYNDTLVFTWDDKVAGLSGNLAFDLGEDTSQLLYVDLLEPDVMTMITPGSVLENLDTTKLTFILEEANILQYGGRYYVEYIDEAQVPAQTFVQIHVNTELDHSLLGIVGSVQGWDIANPVMSIGDDSLGYAVFEMTTEMAAGEFKVLFDTEGDGFAWNVDPEVTPANQAFDMGTDMSIQLYVDATDVDAALHVVAVVDGTDVMVGEYTQTVLPAEAVEESVIMSEMLLFNISNNFIPGDVVNDMGTYAVSKTEIALEYLNINTTLDSLELVNISLLTLPIKTHLAFDSVDYARSQVGEFEETVTCTADENLLMVHLYLHTTVPTELAPIGLVGSVQGWSPENAVAPSGMDANGNYVFEVCVANTEANGVFKVLQDADENGFAWGDVEMTPGDIAFDFDGTTHVYVEEGGSAAGSALQTITLSGDNMLNVNESYQLRFVDENGFVIFLDLDIDNQAPEVAASFVVDVVLEINQGEMFNAMDYFTQLLFLDNRDGEIAYTVTNDIDTSVAGEQMFVVSATDMWDNVGTAEYTFTVIDVIDPVVSLDRAPSLEVGDSEPDWTMYGSANEGTITIDSSQIDMDYAGTYFVIYTATDEAGNSGSESLEVVVAAAEVVVDDDDLDDDTGCFGALGTGTVIAFVAAAILGGAALYFIRKP